MSDDDEDVGAVDLLSQLQWGARGVSLQPSARQLMADFERVKRSQTAQEAQQRWGGQAYLFQSNINSAQDVAGFPAAVPNTFVPIAVGPFPEPRALAINWATDSEQGNNFAQASRPVQLRFICTIGIGQAMFQRVYHMVPPFIMAQSLTVRVERWDNTVGGVGTIYPTVPLVSVWCTPYVERAHLQQMLSQRVTMGVGVTAIGIRDPPYDATHVMVTRGVLSGIALALRINYDSDEVGAASGNSTQEFWMTTNSSAVPSQNILPIPRGQRGFPVAGGTFSLVRNSGTNQDTYEVIWLA